jgi:hypothetical protein
MRRSSGLAAERATYFTQQSGNFGANHMYFTRHELLRGSANARTGDDSGGPRSSPAPTR